jgi:hypothetical protein
MTSVTLSAKTQTTRLKRPTAEISPPAAMGPLSDKRRRAIPQVANHHGDRSNEPEERCRGQHEAQVDDVQRRAAQAVVPDDVGRRGPDRRRWGNGNHHSHYKKAGEQGAGCRFEARSTEVLQGLAYSAR